VSTHKAGLSSIFRRGGVPGVPPCAATVAVALACVTTNAQQRPADYPQWRGPARNGSASAFEVPPTWPERLVRKWRVTVGEGYATPLLVGDTIYTFTRRNNREMATALAATTGATQWETGYDLPYTPSEPTKAHGAGPKATPVFADGTLVTMGITGIVTAFDGTSGRRLWQTAPPAEVPFYSAAASPVAYGSLVLTHPGNYEPLTALDRRTGEVRWRAGAGGFFMSPLIASLGGVTQAVTFAQDGILGVDVDTGAVLWHFPWTGGGTGGASPIVVGDLVVVSASGQGMLALRPARRDTTWNVEAVWETAEAAMYTTDLAAMDGVVYGLSSRGGGQFVAVDANTGAVLWKGPGREATQEALVHQGAHLFILKDDGQLLVTRPSRQGIERIASYTVADGATWAQPVLSGRRILVKDVSTLTLWSLD
jgi:outer membrane protein assembly factor BamB